MPKNWTKRTDSNRRFAEANPESKEAVAFRNRSRASKHRMLVKKMTEAGAKPVVSEEEVYDPKDSRMWSGYAVTSDEALTLAYDELVDLLGGPNTKGPKAGPVEDWEIRDAGDHWVFGVRRVAVAA